MQSRNKSGWVEGSKQWQGVDNGTGVENRREDESYHCSEQDHHWNSTAAIWHQICGMWLKLGLIATITISLKFKGALCKPIGSLEWKQNLDLFVNPLFVIHLLAQIRTYFSPTYCPAMLPWDASKPDKLDLFTTKAYIFCIIIFWSLVQLHDFNDLVKPSYRGYQYI